MADAAPPSSSLGAAAMDPSTGDPDSTLDKMACLEEMINRLEDAAPGPSDMFLRSVLAQDSKEDIANMVGMQKQMLSRFEKTNEMLLNFNALSRGRYEATHQEFRRHTQLLTDMRKDLDNVFRRIRTLRTKLSKQYPHAFNAVAASCVLEEEEDDVASPKHTARPPRPPQPPQVRARSRSNSSNTGTSSPSNRHSWAGYPSKEGGGGAEEAGSNSREDGSTLLHPSSQTDLDRDDATSASTETLRKDSGSATDIHESNDVTTRENPGGSSSNNTMTVTATIETPRHQQQQQHRQISSEAVDSVFGNDDSKKPPRVAAKIVAGEGEEDDD